MKSYILALRIRTYIEFGFRDSRKIYGGHSLLKILDNFYSGYREIMSDESFAMHMLIIGYNNYGLSIWDFTISVKK